MILTSALNQAANKNPGNPAIFDLGKGTSFKEFKDKVGQLSYLYLAEIGHHQRVAFLSDNNPALIYTFFALTNSCSLCIFLNLQDTDEEIAAFLKEIEATHIAVSNSQMRRATELMRNHGLSLPIIEMEKKKGGEYDKSYSPPPEIPLKETDTILVLRTAGLTENRPKTMLFNHRQLYHAATIIRRMYHLSPTDRVFTTLGWSDPFSLVHGLLMPLFNGACCAIDPQFRGQEFVEYIAQHRINRFVDAPNFLFNLLLICQAQKYMLPGVKSVTVGHGVLSTTMRKTFSLLKIPVMHCYGMAENVWTISLEDGEKYEFQSEIRGRALPGLKYKVLNDAGDEIEGPERKEGPLCVTGETVMTAYLHPDPKIGEKATKQMKRGTWLYTGDIARMEGEGEELCVTYLGRQTDLLKTSDGYILLEKVDDALRGAAGVLEGAAFVRMDERGEPHMACAVVKQSKAAGAPEILAHCAQSLQAPALPETVHFLDSLPKDAYGNFNRYSLQRQFSGTA